MPCFEKNTHKCGIYWGFCTKNASILDRHVASTVKFWLKLGLRRKTGRWDLKEKNGIFLFLHFTQNLCQMTCVVFVNLIYVTLAGIIWVVSPENRKSSRQDLSEIAKTDQGLDFQNLTKLIFWHNIWNAAGGPPEHLKTRGNGIIFHEIEETKRSATNKQVFSTVFFPLGTLRSHRPVFPRVPPAR